MGRAETTEIVHRSLHLSPALELECRGKWPGVRFQRRKRRGGISNIDLPKNADRGELIERVKTIDFGSWAEIGGCPRNPRTNPKRSEGVHRREDPYGPLAFAGGPPSLTLRVRVRAFRIACAIRGKTARVHQFRPMSRLGSARLGLSHDETWARQNLNAIVSFFVEDSLSACLTSPNRPTQSLSPVHRTKNWWT